MAKHHKGTLAQVRNTQRLIAKANGLPSPGSRLIDGRWQNVCSACGSTQVAGPPWECAACGWKAKLDPRGCCRRISSIRACGTDFVLSLEGADPENPRLTEQSKAALRAAVEAGIEIDPDQLGDEIEDE